MLLVLVLHCFSLVVSFHSSADTTIYINPDFPEKNGEFFVHRVSDVKASTGNELIDLLKITLPHLIDLRDLKNWSGHVVLDGQGFLVTMPSVPHFLLHDHEVLFENEKTRCPRTEEAHAVVVNDILAKPAHQVKRVLLLFPKGMTCSADLSATSASSTDQKVKMVLRQATIKSQEKFGKGMKSLAQVFYPSSWVLRILDDNRRLLKRDKNLGEDDDLESAFAGMKW